MIFWRMSLADKKQTNQRFKFSFKKHIHKIKGLIIMQNQNIRPIPNDDEWPLATVFDVTANQYFITIMTTSPPNIYFNMDECPQMTNSQHVHNLSTSLGWR